MLRGGSPRPVGDVLARYMSSSGLKEKLRSPEIYDCWPEVAGAEASKHTRVVGLTNCVLHVEVDSAPWLHMLATFKKPELLAGLRATLSAVRVRDIKFRIGNCGSQNQPQMNADYADDKTKKHLRSSASICGQDPKPERTKWPKRPNNRPTTPGTSRSCRA